MRLCIVLGLMVAVASAMVTNQSHYYTKTADMEYLHKQKKIFDLLMYVDQNVLSDTEYFEIGRNYDIASNIDHYTNREYVMEFLDYYKVGMLNKNALFTYYQREHREEMMMLYRLFYTAKDFTTFYKTACWARIHMNSGMFTTAFTTAVIYRNDTKYIRLPAIYEIYPNLFFDSKTIHEAYRIKMTRGHSYRGYDFGMKHSEPENVETFYVSANYTGMCVSPKYEQEHKLFYFMEDVGLNAFYYYFRMAYPFWLSTKDYDMPKSFRGDFYYFYHKQLMARYYLERYSNDLGEIEDFSWDKMRLPGFYSGIVYGNGVAMPRRDWWNIVPYYKYRNLEYLKKLEVRIMEAIDSGYFYDEMGKQISLYTPEGLNYLGNLIEGNGDSYNLKYYGAYEVLAREILGMNYNYKNKNYYVPSSLEFFGTSMRDPAFYRIYDKILYFFQKYKSLLHRYNKSELAFPGVRFESIDVDKLYTYFDSKDYFINNAVAVDSFKEGKAFSIKASQQHLNYKPFSYKFTINSDKDTTAVMRIFLGPASFNDKYDHSYFLQYYKYFFMLDEFDVNLKSGLNNFERQSSEAAFFKDMFTDGQTYYHKILKAIEGGEPFTYDERMFDFPRYLMLPKGKADGKKFTMFFYIGPKEEAKTIEVPVFGPNKYYGKSFGFPLDRPVYPWFFKLDNVYFKNVFIYHINDYEMKYNRQY